MMNERLPRGRCTPLRPASIGGLLLLLAFLKNAPLSAIEASFLHMNENKVTQRQVLLRKPPSHEVCFSKWMPLGNYGDGATMRLLRMRGLVLILSLEGCLVAAGSSFFREMDGSRGKNESPQRQRQLFVSKRAVYYILSPIYCYCSVASFFLPSTGGRSAATDCRSPFEFFSWMEIVYACCDLVGGFGSGHCREC